MVLFSARVRRQLVRIDAMLNQAKYIDVLKQYVLPFKLTHHSVSNEFLHQHDGSGAHRAKKVSTFLEAERVNVLHWPAQSPDLNPIENVWAIMKRRPRKLHTYPTTTDQLFNMLYGIWDELPEEYFAKLIASMSSR